MQNKSAYRSLESKHILVVEDVEMNQYLARHIMESWGCIVEIAQNGKEGWEKVAAGSFDLVLMDIQMPVMDGIEATGKIRGLSDQVKASTPIVALTANAVPGDCSVYLQAGMNDCLPKPFNEHALFLVIEKNIAKRFDMNNVSGTASASVQSPIAQKAEKLYDLSLVEAISGGDKEFVKKMVELFLQTIPELLQQIRDAADSQQWEALSKHAHKLKSTIDSMNIILLKDHVRSIEAAGKKNEVTGETLALVDKLLNTMEQVIVQVKADFGL